MWFVMRRKSIAQFREEKTRQVEEEIQRERNDIEMRLRAEVDAIPADANRDHELQNIYRKYMEEIRQKMEKASKVAKSTTNNRESEDKNRLLYAYIDVGNKLQAEMQKYDDAKIETETTRLARESGITGHDEMLQKINVLQQNIQLSLTLQADYVRDSLDPSIDDTEKEQRIVMSAAFGAEAKRTIEELRDIKNGELPEWIAEREDVKRWIIEYWARCNRALSLDTVLKKMIDERLELARSFAKTVDVYGPPEINPTAQTLLSELRELDHEIETFGASTVAAGGDRDKVIVRAPERIERIAVWVLERFELLLLTRKIHRDVVFSGHAAKAVKLQGDMREHLRNVERKYNTDTEVRERQDSMETMRRATGGSARGGAARAASGSARRAADREAGAAEPAGAAAVPSPRAISRYDKYTRSPETEEAMDAAWYRGSVWNFPSPVVPDVSDIVFPSPAVSHDSDTVAASDASIDWAIVEKCVTFRGGIRVEGTARTHWIKLAEGQSLFEAMTAKQPLSEWKRVVSKTFVSDGTAHPPELYWERSPKLNTELTCRRNIDKFCRRTTANGNVVNCHMLLYTSSNGC